MAAHVTASAAPSRSLEAGVDSGKHGKPFHLFLIDVQRDFHPLLAGEDGERPLGVPGANEDAQRVVSGLIDKHMDQITHITVTLDSHEVNDIGHAHFWVRDKSMAERYVATLKGNEGDAQLRIKHPAPFTSMHYASFEDAPGFTARPTFIGTGPTGDRHFWTPGDPALRRYCEEYFMELQSKELGMNKLSHVVWPYHCLEGGEGANVVPLYSDALMRWSAKTGKDVKYVFKGRNRLCEMYSAIRAEVPVQGDWNTYANVDLIAHLRDSLLDANCAGLVVAGQALGYSVRFTIEDLVRLYDVQTQVEAEDRIKEFSPLSHLPSKGHLAALSRDSDPTSLLRKIHLLRDGCSNIGDGKEGKEFLDNIEDIITIVTVDEMSEKVSTA